MDRENVLFEYKRVIREKMNEATRQNLSPEGMLKQEMLKLRKKLDDLQRKQRKKADDEKLNREIMLTAHQLDFILEMLVSVVSSEYQRRYYEFEQLRTKVNKIVAAKGKRAVPPQTIMRLQNLKNSVMTIQREVENYKVMRVTIEDLKSTGKTTGARAADTITMMTNLHQVTAETTAAAEQVLEAEQQLTGELYDNLDGLIEKDESLSTSLDTDIDDFPSIDDLLTEIEREDRTKEKDERF